MTRLRWLGASWPVSMRTIGVRMKAAEFTANATDGFLVERVRDTGIDGQYIEKLSYEVIVVDPFGNEERAPRVEYRRTKFRLCSVFPQIELLDSPRSLQGFTSRLGEINDFSVTISSVDVDVGTWIESFLGSLKRTAFLDAIQTGAIAFGNGVIGKVFLRGRNDVRRTLMRIVGGRDHQIEKAIVKIENGRKWSTVQFGRDCSIRINGGPVDDLLQLVRLALIQSNSRESK